MLGNEGNEMKIKVTSIFFAAVLAMMLSNEVPASFKSEVGQSMIKVVALTVAAMSTALATSEYEEWINKTLDYEKLKEYKGYDGKAAMYSLDVNLDKSIGGFFSGYPDVFFVVRIEGEGEYIAPYIEYGFKGGRILKSLLATNYKPGSKIQVIVYDSDSTSNEILNNLFKTKIYASGNFSIGGVVSVELSTSGIQIIRDEQKLMIDAPDLIASVIFDTPKDGDYFVGQGSFEDKNGKQIGSIEIKKVWEKELDKSLFKTIFYLIIGIGFLIIFIKKVIIKS